MPRTDSTRPRLLGRDAELRALAEAWRRADRGRPQLVLITGPTGRGKTRLVQELYAGLAAGQPEDGRYWPARLPERAGMSLVPPPPEDASGELPWLWLAMRSADPRARNSMAAMGRSLDALRSQIGGHLAAFYSAVQRRSRGREIGKSGLTLLAGFAFPGAGGLVEVGSQIVGALDRGVSAWDAVRTLGEEWRVRGREEAAGGAAEEELLEALDAASTKIRRADGSFLPVVLVWDDAHWADDETAGAVGRLLDRAQERRWPFLLVITSWDEGLDGYGLPRAEPRAPVARLLERAELLAALDGASDVERLGLGALPRRHADAIVRERLPRLPEAARRLLMERAGGDLDLLEDYCAELASGIGWLDEDGTLLVDVEALRELPSTKADMARRLLRSAGREVAEVLALGSAQGARFFGSFLVAMAEGRVPPTDVEQLLEAADRRLRLCSVRRHDALGHDAEFRSPLYYELSRQAFDRLPTRGTLLRTLAAELRTAYEQGRLDGCPPVERLDVLEDLLTVASAERLWDQDVWQDLLLRVALEVAQLQLSLGHLQRSRATAETVRGRLDAADPLRQEALDLLCHEAHMSGDAEREDALLAEWAAVDAAERIAGAAIRLARRDVRERDPDGAVRVLEQALRRPGVAEADRARLGIELCRARCYAGRAPEALPAIERLIATLPPRERELAAAADHALYMTLHDLDLNARAAEVSEGCVQRFRSSGLLEEELLCTVNLGDARWGTGDAAGAQATLRDAEQRADEAGLPHARNLARLCLANVTATADADAALALYDRAIADAEDCRWAWDALYGRIYRELLMSERSGAGGRELRRLAGQARVAGYAGLADWAEGFSLVADTDAGAAPDPGTLESCARSRFPGTRAYAAGAALLAADTPAGERDRARAALAAAVEATEGIKGRPRFIEAALARAAG